MGNVGALPALFDSYWGLSGARRQCLKRPKCSVSGRRVDFGYDAGWRRVRKTVTPWDEQASGWAGTPSLDRRFLWSGWRMLLELDMLAAEPDEPLRALSWGLDLAGLGGSQGGRASAGLFEQAGTIGGLLAVRVCDVSGSPEPDDPVDYVYLYDALGNVGQVVDWSHDAQQPGAALTARYEYDPYGGVTKAQGDYAADNAWRFSTKQWDDETGLGWWGKRYYDGLIGRWMSWDPIGERGGLNLYAFARNAPLDYVDAIGLTDRRDGARVLGTKGLGSLYDTTGEGYSPPTDLLDDVSPPVREAACIEYCHTRNGTDGLAYESCLHGCKAGWSTTSFKQCQNVCRQHALTPVGTVFEECYNGCMSKVADLGDPSAYSKCKRHFTIRGHGVQTVDESGAPLAKPTYTTPVSKDYKTSYDEDYFAKTVCPQLCWGARITFWTCGHGSVPNDVGNRLLSRCPKISYARACTGVLNVVDSEYLDMTFYYDCRGTWVTIPNPNKKSMSHYHEAISKPLKAREAYRSYARSR
ncbi:MAG: RHS repeat-associated core domain-containing protein [Phycisphaerales bacterium]|nr:RHS repeat-associated core domain-containing protein [Phycisphaerales bacterium]